MDIKNLKPGQRVLVRSHALSTLLEGPAIILALYPGAEAVKVEMCDEEEEAGSITVRASEIIKELPL